MPQERNPLQQPTHDEARLMARYGAALLDKSATGNVGALKEVFDGALAAQREFQAAKRTAEEKFSPIYAAAEILRAAERYQAKLNTLRQEAAPFRAKAQKIGESLEFRAKPAETLQAEVATWEVRRALMSLDPARRQLAFIQAVQEGDALTIRSFFGPDLPGFMREMLFEKLDPEFVKQARTEIADAQNPGVRDRLGDLKSALGSVEGLLSDAEAEASAILKKEK